MDDEMQQMLKGTTQATKEEEGAVTMLINLGAPNRRVVAAFAGPSSSEAAAADGAEKAANRKRLRAEQESSEAVPEPKRVAEIKVAHRIFGVAPFGVHDVKPYRGAAPFSAERAAVAPSGCG